MHIYAVAIEKGGTGKSTLSVNLAAALGRLNYRVLVLDLDAQGHASYWLGHAPGQRPVERSLIGVLNGQPLATCVVGTNEFVDLIPAHPMISSLPVQLASMPNAGLFVLSDLLKQLEQRNAYDVVVLDLAPARGLVMASALAAATRCLSPVQAEELVIQALKALNESVQQAQRVNPNLRGMSILRNRYGPRSSGDIAYDQLLRKHYADQLFRTVIPIRAALRDSAGLQQSVFTYNGADAHEVRNLFLDLVEELIALDEVA